MRTDRKKDNRYEAYSYHNCVSHFRCSFVTPEEEALRVAHWLCVYAPAHEAALAAAASVQGTEVAATTLASAEEAALSGCFARSLNEAAAEVEPTLPDAAARTAMALASVPWHLAGCAAQYVNRRKHTLNPAAGGGAFDLAHCSSGLETSEGS